MLQDRHVSIIMPPADTGLVAQRVRTTRESHGSKSHVLPAAVPWPVWIFPGHSAMRRRLRAVLKTAAVWLFKFGSPGSGSGLAGRPGAEV